jgi:hypothetical protein
LFTDALHRSFPGWCGQTLSVELRISGARFSHCMILENAEVEWPNNLITYKEWFALYTL